ncbi:hypothetical protein [Shimazuella alba]|uniref:Uncharacterized protein n=1 Tax=Shimazuella alba TaxID=2690964 RepID=A0A6I4VWS6_9BACL|nr:hypothetical protein [Shimazuella alba]MXQ54350.1 hypothetical protein [Shimazuella alba]
MPGELKQFFLLAEKTFSLPPEVTLNGDWSCFTTQSEYTSIPSLKILENILQLGRTIISRTIGIMVPFDSHSYVTEVDPIQLHSNDTGRMYVFMAQKVPSYDLPSGRIGSDSITEGVLRFALGHFPIHCLTAIHL